jgi:5-methylthioadenosine/S-adenosylhomocysteine deaminase
VEYSPPHLINYAAILAALKSLSCERVVAVCSVGSLKASLGIGALLVPDDYYNPYSIRSMHTDAKSHWVPALDATIRRDLLRELSRAGLSPIDGGVYAQANGPRFETKAEIRALAAVGDVVGMTAAHEASMAQDAGVPYAMFAMVDNFAHGVADPLSLAAFHKGQRDNIATVEAATAAIIAFYTAAAVEGAAAAPCAAPSRVAVDLVVFAAWVVPVEQPAPAGPAGAGGADSAGGAERGRLAGNAGVLPDHAVVVTAGRIVDVLPGAEAKRLYAPAATVVLPEHALMPGLVNAHTHAAMCNLRGVGDDMPLMDWLTKRVWPAEAAHVSEGFVRDGCLLAAAEMLRSGTTCCNDMYHFGEAAAEVFSRVGLRAVVGLPVLEFPTAYASNAEEYIAKGQALHAAYARAPNPLLTFAWAPHAPYTVSDAHFRRVVELAEAMDTKVHTHLHETADECASSAAGDRASMHCHQSEHRCRPFENLDRLGVVGPRLIAAHCTHLTPAEIARLQAAGASVVHCPTSNLKLASGVCPLAPLLKAGVTVALGTDGACSNNGLDMMAEMRLASLLAKGVSGDATVAGHSEILRVATLGGARALGLGAVTGSLLPGKWADMVAVRLGGEVETAPMYEVVSHIVYAARREQVTDVWVAGKQLLKSRQLTTIDEPALLKTAAGWGARVAEKLQQQ